MLLTAAQHMSHAKPECLSSACPEAVMVSHLHALSISAMLGLSHLSVDTLTLLWSQVPSISTKSNSAGDAGTQSPMPASDAPAAPQAGSLDFLWDYLLTIAFVKQPGIRMFSLQSNSCHSQGLMFAVIELSVHTSLPLLQPIHIVNVRVSDDQII